jgi:hypothetical protein
VQAMKAGDRSLTELWAARDERVKKQLMACEEARRVVEKAWADGADADAAEARLSEAKQQLEDERLRPAHFRCFRRKPGDSTGVFQEVDLACEEDQVALSLVVLSSEPCLPPSNTHRNSAVSIWPNAMGTFEILAEEQRRYVAELVKIVPVAEPDKMDKKRPPPPGARKFALAWKAGGRQELFSPAFEEIEETIGQHLTRFKRRRVARVARALGLWQAQRVPYDKTNPEHEAKLMRLWQLARPGEPLTGRVSAQWKALGFQGTDPATDFRGMGVLGLELLLFLAERRPGDMRKILANKLDYPFACAAINVAAIMFEKLNFTAKSAANLNTLFHSSEQFDTPLMHFFCRVENEDVFEETFSCLCLLTDARFEAVAATYMQFPKVLEWVRGVLEDQRFGRRRRRETSRYRSGRVIGLKRHVVLLAF